MSKYTFRFPNFNRMPTRPKQFFPTTWPSCIMLWAPYSTHHNTLLAIPVGHYFYIWSNVVPKGRRGKELERWIERERDGQAVTMTTAARPCVFAACQIFGGRMLLTRGEFTQGIDPAWINVLYYGVQQGFCLSLDYSWRQMSQSRQKTLITLNVKEIRFPVDVLINWKCKAWFMVRTLRCPGN